jgi:hypothetical protein
MRTTTKPGRQRAHPRADFSFRGNASSPSVEGVTRGGTRLSAFVVVGVALLLAAIGMWRFGARERERSFAAAPRPGAGAATAPASRSAADTLSPAPAGHGASGRAAVDPAAHVYQAAAQNVRELAAYFRKKFVDLLDYDAYRRCIEQGGACTDELSRLLYMASAELQDSISEDAFDIGALVAAHGPHAVQQALIEDLRGIRDPVERYAALHLLTDWDSGVQPVELPPDLYSEVERRPMAEAQLLLTRHQFTPVKNQETKARLAELGAEAETDSRLWGSIIHSLGHEETAAELRRAVTSRKLDGISSLTAAVAAARCGLACLETLRAIAAEGQEGRMAVLHSLQGLDPADISKALSALAFDRPRSAEEQALVSELLNKRDRR